MYKKIISLNESIVNTIVEVSGSDQLIKKKDDDRQVLSDPVKAYITALRRMQMTSLEEIEFWKEEKDKVQEYFAQEVRKLEETGREDSREKVKQIKELAAKKDETISLIIDQLEQLYGRDSGLITREEEETWGKILLGTSEKHEKTIERIPRHHWEKEFNLAVNVLVKANLRKVVSIAKEYRRNGRSFPDLIQMGNEGLLKGVVRFDSRKGFRVSSYCGDWIRQAVRRGVKDNGKIIEVSYEVSEINEFARRVVYSKSEGNPVHWSEMDYEWLTREIRKETDNKKWKEKLTPKKVKQVIKYSNLSVLSEVRNGDGEVTDVFDLLAIDKNIAYEEVSSLVPFDPEADTVPKAVDEKQVKQLLKEVILELAPREQGIINLRFGISADREYTLEEVGKRYEVTGERIRTIEKKVLEKLRHPARKEKLRGAAEVLGII